MKVVNQLLLSVLLSLLCTCSGPGNSHAIADGTGADGMARADGRMTDRLSEVVDTDRIQGNDIPDAQFEVNDTYYFV